MASISPSSTLDELISFLASQRAVKSAKYLENLRTLRGVLIANGILNVGMLHSVIQDDASLNRLSLSHSATAVLRGLDEAYLQHTVGKDSLVKIEPMEVTFPSYYSQH